MLDKLYSGTIPTIEVQDLEGKTDQYQILDTRESEEYTISHIADAQCVGYDDFSPQSVAHLDKDKPVLVYCSVGYRSEKIGEQLKELGFTEVYNLYGGIFEWKNKGQAVVDTSNQPTEKVHTFNRLWGQWLTNGEKVY